MRILIFQHLACEHPGIFRDFMRADGVETVTVQLDAGGPIPPLASADALLVFGGPMNVDEEAAYPWLIPETEAIREAALAGMPILGVCLGGQLLAKALGAAVTKNSAPEVGLLEMDLTDAGVSDPLFRGWPRKPSVVQWHSDSFAMPAGGVRLASSPACSNQAFRYGNAAYGLQFHPEVTAEMVVEWGDIPEYASAMEKVQWRTGRNPFASVVPNTETLARRARLLYDNFLGLVQAAR